MEEIHSSDFSYANAGENGIAMRWNDGTVQFSHFRDSKSGDEDFTCNVVDRESWRSASRIARCLDRYGACTLVNNITGESIDINPGEFDYITVDFAALEVV